jgi:hypothetical protein
LHDRGIPAVAPTLESEGVDPPYWKHHASCVVASLSDVPSSQPVVLVGHSGAGPFLPTARTGIQHPIHSYIFTDAGLPGPDGASRFDLFESPNVVQQFRLRAKKGQLPIWTDLVGLSAVELQELIPARAVREKFVTELRPMPLAVYEEPLPVPSEWPDAPCGYLLFSSAYKTDLERARRAAWLCLEVSGGHFHMLVNPAAVADALLHLAQALATPSDQNRQFGQRT